jgi:urease accessory protein UreF
MGVLRATELALVGLVGAAVAWWYEVGAMLRQYPEVEAALDLPLVAGLVAEHGIVLDWSAGAFVAIVAADLVASLRRDGDGAIRLGPTLGVGTGLTAVVAGVVALAFDGAILAAFAEYAPEVAAVVRQSLGEAGFCFALGVWVGAVVAELVGL